MIRKVIEKRKSGHGHRYIMECLYCGKEFEMMGFEFNSGTGKFCSRKCFYKAMKEKPELLFDERECEYCGERFQPASSVQKYCSGKCYNKAQYEEYRENHDMIYEKDGSWVEWKENRKRALVRDDFECQDCGSKENIEVHHIDGTGSNIPFSEKNNDLDNLVALCHKCHLQRHADRGDIKGFSQKEIDFESRNAYIIELCEEHSQTDVAKMFDLTRQRVHQIVKEFH